MASVFDVNPADAGGFGPAAARAALVRLHKLLAFEPDGGTAPAELRAALVTEIESLGYLANADLVAAFAACSERQLLALRSQILQDLGLSPAMCDSAPLFRSFPYETPEPFAYLVARIGAMLAGRPTRRLDIMSGRLDEGWLGRVTRLSCGHAILPGWFDLEAFSACPICQHQVPEIDSAAVPARHEFRTDLPLPFLGLADDRALETIVGELLARPGSLSADERCLVVAFGRHAPLASNATIFRETLPLLFSTAPDLVCQRISTATDVLRLAVHMSDKTADLSLATPVRFRIGRAHGRILFELLQTMAGAAGGTILAQQMLRHRERWLRLGEILHPGTPRNRSRYPAVAEAFDQLRRQPRSIPALSRTLAVMLRTGGGDPAVFDQAPGVGLRQLDSLLRRPALAAPTLAWLGRQRGLATPALLQTWKHLRWRAGLVDRAETAPPATESRVFFPKGGHNKMYVRSDPLPPLSPAVATPAIEAIEAQLRRRFAAIGIHPPGTAFRVDPVLDRVALPINRRGDAATAGAAKGDRLALTTPVARVFIWWRGDIDVDLSALFYDADFQPIGTVYYGNIDRFRGAVHSGDVQNAPNGAFEFIDLELDALPAACRYVGVLVNSYRGDNFDGFPCCTGVMLRDQLRSGAPFEPRSVRFRMELTAATTASLPLLIDRAGREAQVVDMTMKTGRGANAMSSSRTSRELLAMTVDLPRRRPTYGDLARLYAAAAGHIVETGTRDADPAVVLLDRARLDDGLRDVLLAAVE